LAERFAGVAVDDEERFASGMGGVDASPARVDGDVVETADDWDRVRRHGNERKHEVEFIAGG